MESFLDEDERFANFVRRGDRAQQRATALCTTKPPRVADLPRERGAPPVRLWLATLRCATRLTRAAPRQVMMTFDDESDASQHLPQERLLKALVSVYELIAAVLPPAGRRLITRCGRSPRCARCTRGPVPTRGARTPQRAAAVGRGRRAVARRRRLGL